MLYIIIYLFLKELENELHDMRPRKNLNSDSDKKFLNKTYNILNSELVALKEETVRMLMCGVGDREIADRVADHLDKVSRFFSDQLHKIDWAEESTLSPQCAALVLEHLKKLFEQNLSQMEVWIDWIIESK